ncbi:hypothetical protein IMZ48_10565 [Candidatus Bathyarchaeota archaeon]|nr:hypothetical protein [Candidatus Bathyarchaeota archaeon]
MPLAREAKGIAGWLQFPTRILDLNVGWCLARSLLLAVSEWGAISRGLRMSVIKSEVRGSMRGDPFLDMLTLIYS